MFGYEEAPKGGAVRWLCNPNNPTGEVRTTDTVKVLSRRHHWLVIDQSYEDYTYKTLLTAQEALALENVIVIHSMTKRFAIPGLRLGYVIAPPDVIDSLRANSRPWAVNALAIEAGHWLLDNGIPYYHELMSTLFAETYYLRNRLRSIFGIHVYPTCTNFMLCSVGLILSRLQGGRALRKGRLTHNAAEGMVISFVGYTLFIAAPGWLGYYGSALLIGLGNGHMWPAFQNMTISVASNKQRGTANSIILISWDIDMGLGILVGGIVSELLGYAAAFWTVVLVNGAGVLCFFLATKMFFLRRNLNASVH
jgi:hypothetical protein